MACANEFRRDAKPYYQNGVTLKDIEPLLPSMADLGWHLQLWIDARDLPELLPALAHVSVRVVIDHMGRMDYHYGTRHPGFQALLRGVGEGRLWSKLSGTYRLGATPPDYLEARPFHDALIAANPQTLVWGTDWRHPRPEGPVPDAARLLKVFLDWTTPEIRQAILVDNPSLRTYLGFFSRCRLRSRTPGPPPFSSINSTRPTRRPACHAELLIRNRVQVPPPR